MRAFLLAAGLGSRLRPLTGHTPKCLVSIHGRPLMAYWFDLLFPACERVLVNTHYLPDQVEAFAAASPWADRIDLVREPCLLGTGGSLLANRAWFGEGDFLVAHADNLTRFDLGGFVECHRKRPPGVDITMMTFRTDSPGDCGVVELDDEGRVIGFHEKVANPPGNLANAAVYLFSPRPWPFMFSLGNPLLDISLDVLPAYVGRMQAWENRGYHRDIGTPASFALAEQEFPPAPETLSVPAPAKGA